MPRQISADDVPSEVPRVWRETFARGARDAAGWKLAAESLLRAAAQILPVVDADMAAMADESGDVPVDAIMRPVMGVYLMLAGLAIENLAKGVLIARGDITSDSDDRLPSGLKSHDVLALTERAIGTLDEQKQWLCQRLTSYVTWAGRYPLPLKPEGFVQKTPAGDGTFAVMMFLSTDARHVEEIVRDLYAALASHEDSAGDRTA